MLSQNPIETLDEIGIRHNTDKASITKNQDGLPRRGHHYLSFYEFFFKEFKNSEFTFLELGVGPDWRSGASLFTFQDYFKNAQIVGVDIRETAALVTGTRIRIEIGDLGSERFLSSLKLLRPSILIDDASHFWHHQVMALCHLWPSVQSRGIYVVEDVHTSFGRFKDAGQHSGGQAFTAYRFIEIITEIKQDPRLEFTELPEYLVVHARKIAKECAFIAFARHTVLLKKQ